jgi:hypothetical protein
VHEAGYFDDSIWTSAHSKGDAALQTLIRQALIGTTATVVLIGNDTWTRKWVHFEIAESRKKGNGLLGIHMPNQIQVAQKARIGAELPTNQPEGRNPFSFHRKSGTQISTASDGLRPTRIVDAVLDLLDPRIDSLVPVYRWKHDDGYNNLGEWIDLASRNGHITKL